MAKMTPTMTAPWTEFARVEKQWIRDLMENCSCGVLLVDHPREAKSSHENFEALLQHCK